MAMIEEIIGSKGRVALFRELFDGNERSAHIREIARKYALTAPSLMREAKALVKRGLLSEVVDGNRVDYSARRDSPLYPVICELVKKTCGGEAMLREAFADSNDPVVFIYGSRARGDARAESDYDIFVIGNEGLRKVTARTSKVMAELGIEVNPYVITPGEFAKRMNDGDHFLSEVMSGPKIFLKGGEDELGRLA